MITSSSSRTFSVSDDHRDQITATAPMSTLRPSVLVSTLLE
jgi:hypothetical protein